LVGVQAAFAMHMFTHDLGHYRRIGGRDVE